MDSYQVDFRPLMELGDFKLHVVSDGGFRLDGGAMFGVVPKVLWQKKSPPDERNRIRMATNCLLIESSAGLVLLDSGIGDKNDERFRDMFGMEKDANRLPQSLADAGFSPDDIDHVLLTHLHFDHCGWNTRMDGRELVPTFPNATYWIEAGELEHARRPSLRDRASYDDRNWEPLFEADVVKVFEDGVEPVPGVRATKVPGHNFDMCVVQLESNDDRGIFWADLVPTTSHLPYPWVMGFDLLPLQTVENKQHWLPRAHREEWLCFFEHDPDVPCARLTEDKPGRYGAEPVGV